MIITLRRLPIVVVTMTLLLGVMSWSTSLADRADGSAAASGDPTVASWADFQAQLPANGVLLPDLALGGGSLVDVMVTYSGPRVVAGQVLGAIGTGETGLNYTVLNMLGVGGPGGAGTTVTTIVFSNFRAAPNHTRGFIAVGAVDGVSTVSVTSSTGNTNTWTLVGVPFVQAMNGAAISWVPGVPGTFVSSGVPGNNSKIAVVSFGQLGAYVPGATITITANQNLVDGIVYGIGEELAHRVLPAMTPPGWAVLALWLLGAGAVFIVKRRVLVA